jgi:hypothetical protein
MIQYNISKTYKCVFGKEVETLGILFFECTFSSQLFLLIKNWIFALSNGIICLNFKNIMLETFQKLSKLSVLIEIKY